MRSITIVALLIGSALGGCRKTNDTQIATSIGGVYDMTDTLLMLPEATEVLDLYHFETNKDHGAGFRFLAVSDTKLNPAVEYTLETGAASDNANTRDFPRYRDFMITSFCKQIETTIDEYRKWHLSTGEIKYSECYFAIAEQLKWLARSNARRRYLLVFSNLFENTNYYSCYSPAGMEKLLQAPDSLAKQLTAINPLPENLVGIKVVFVFKPKNQLEEKVFLGMFGIYKELLESRGARVSYHASNKQIERAL